MTRRSGPRQPWYHRHHPGSTAEPDPHDDDRSRRRRPPRRRIALADELPYWGWLPDDRTCLTRRGELVTLARLDADRRGRPHARRSWTPCSTAGNGCSQASTPGPGSISTCSAGRRPSPTPIPACRRSPTSGNGSGARSSASRIQQLETYPRVVLRPPKLSTAAHGKGNNQPWWKTLFGRRGRKRKRNPNEAVYFREQIEDAAARFRQQVDASRTLVVDLTPARHPQRTRRLPRSSPSWSTSPAVAPWEGATGSGLNWRLAYERA